MKKFLLVGVAAISLVSAAFATSKQSSNPVLLTAQFSLSQVAHKLFPAGDKSAPKLFYKSCSLADSKPYNHATGQGVFWYNPATDTFKYAFTYSGLSGSPVMAHFHIGKSSTGGPIVQTICGMPPPSAKKLGYSAPALSARVCPKGRSGFLTGTYKLRGNPHVGGMTTAQEKQALMEGKIYINIHTCLNQAGELRGQVVPLD